MEKLKEIFPKKSLEKDYLKQVEKNRKLIQRDKRFVKMLNRHI
jgi:hypothetical protein